MGFPFLSRLLFEQNTQILLLLCARAFMVRLRDLGAFG